jgi:hypothetical protein
MRQVKLALGNEGITKMNRLLTLFVALLCVATGFSSTLTDKIARASQAQVNEIARVMAESISKDTPAQVNRTTRLLSAMFVSSTRTLIYHYETTDYIFSDTARSRVVAGVCSDEILHALLKKTITFRYDYALPSGTRILSISINSRDCL